MLTPVPPSDCARARESASARLDGELAELDAARLDVHLNSCSECQSFADEIAKTGGLLRAALPDRPAAAMFTPIHQGRRIGALPAAATAAIVIAVAGSSFAVGGILGGRQGSQAPTPTTIATSASGGSIDALMLPSLVTPRSKISPARIRTIAL
jgi:predicted anti-sigma-YlaC factor YlaD